jgi:hypothetical protein
MAKGKKSFVLYSDQQELFEALTDEQAGKLIKHIFKYVNDENPTLNDALLSVAFVPIKQQLKRDLQAWEKQLQQRIEAGKKSAESRQRNSTTVNERSRTSTDNVNVNVNDNVIESSEGKPSTQKTLVERKQKFKEDCFPLIEQYGKPMMTKFFLYWSEHSERGQKMRFEKEKVFDIKLRVATWAAREKEYKKPEVQIDPLVEHVRKMTGK